MLSIPSPSPDSAIDFATCSAGDAGLDTPAAGAGSRRPTGDRASLLRERASSLGMAPAVELASRRKASLQPVVSRDVLNVARLRGRLTELTGGADSAAVSLAVSLMKQAKRRGDAVVWEADPTRLFFPDDAYAAGLDVEAVVVVSVADPLLVGTVADRLARSGAMGLLVIDAASQERVQVMRENALKGRLVQLARRHDMAIVCITEHREPVAPAYGVLGPMVGFRVYSSYGISHGSSYGESYGARADGDRCTSFWGTWEVCKDTDGPAPVTIRERCLGPVSMH